MNKTIVVIAKNSAMYARGKKMRIRGSKAFIAGTLMLVLAACSSNKTSFQCPNAKGLTCMPIDRVYAMIQSGEVEHIENQTLKCNGRVCKEIVIPELRLNKVYKAKLVSNTEPEPIQIEPETND